MKKVIVIGAVIQNDKNEILCAQRSEQMSQPFLWEFPGGKLEIGESHKECLQREIKEELGCEIIVGKFITDVCYMYPQVHIHLYTYNATINKGSPFPKEHAQLKWTKREELRLLKWAPADIPTIDKLL